MKNNLNLPKSFLSLSKIYLDRGFRLFLIGGSSRDLLLGRFCRDFDLATDAKPEEEKAFLNDADFTFSRFGTIKVNHMGDKFDIATFREEGDYSDYRHPKSIEFITDMETDSKRRDFTINAIYIDRDGRIHDFHGGYGDLDKRLIRFIGDPKRRIEEDPLRILRAERFARTLGFQIEEESKRAIDDNYALLDKLNPEKVKMEKKKG